MNLTNRSSHDQEGRNLQAQELTSIKRRKEHLEQVVHPPQSTEHDSFVLFHQSKQQAVRIKTRIREVDKCQNSKVDADMSSG